MKKELSFNEFDKVSAAAWKQKIQVDLKGADYNETLVWKSPDGIDVKPFYHNDESSSPFSPISGQPQHWNIGQAIFIDDVAIANQLATDALNRGAEALFFTATSAFDIDALLQNLIDKANKIYFDLKFLSPSFSKDKSFHHKNIVVLNDSIHHHTQDGNWFTNMKTDFEDLKTIFKSTNTLAVDVAHYQNAGATNVQQLAYALAHANEYFNALQEHLSPTTTVVFKVAIGSNYFFEIAKIRALRLVYNSLAKEYNLNGICHIAAMPTKRNKTLYDYNVNMLRTTTECMSAIIGGADTICNQPYDAIYHKSNEFGERISRNQLLLLKHESYFDSVTNAADGVYYIEQLTTQLTEKALSVFKEIERGGGFLQQLKEGVIQKKIKESAAKEQAAFDKGEKVLLGTNKHPNKDDKMKHDLELFPFVKKNPRKTHIEPIIEKRLAEVVEQERLNNE